MSALEEIDLENVFTDEMADDASSEDTAEFKAACEFLASVWGADEHGALTHVHMIAEKLRPKGFEHHCVKSVRAAVKVAFRIASAGQDAYFACAAFDSFRPGNQGNRTQANAVAAHSFWLDIDCGPNKDYPDQTSAASALRDFCRAVSLPKPSFIVHSGNGLHCYWRFREPIDKEQWCEKAKQLKALAHAKGLKADPTRTADIASVMRVPGTTNWKDPDNPKRVVVLSASGERDFSSFVAALPRSAPVQSLADNTPKAVRDFPPSSALKIIASCPTLAHVAATGGAVSEPLWRATLGVVKYTTEGEALCHEWSKGDRRYDHGETQKKINLWTAGPTRCDTFRNMNDAQCKGCTQKCRSPIQLGHPVDADPLKVAKQDLNLRHFVAKVGGGVFVFDEQDERILADAMSFAAFRQFHAGHKINGKSVATEWLSSRGRRTYSSLVFDPSGNCPKGSYNTWHGLTVVPKQGECGEILAHIRDVWCGGDDAQFEYVLKWMALLVQNPWIKPEVALVLRSEQGTGKTMIVQMLLDIFGVHGFTTAQKDQVAGRFNAHLFDKVLVVLEEAFFAGDPAAVASAKALVTNRKLGYEAKGKDAFSAPNYAHVITLTNNEWAVPAGADARRWMVLDMSEARMGDHAYFTALANHIENGGKEAFLGYLLSIPLDGWNPRVLPRSDGLHAQQVETLRRCDAVAAWWLAALSEGEFPVEGGAVAWATEISAGEMQESYTWATKGARNAPSFDVAAKKLRKLLPAGALAKIRKSHHGDRYFSYQLPDLEEARQHFKTVTGIDPCAI